jgi:GDP-mannose 6-dehydrogenase
MVQRIDEVLDFADTLVIGNAAKEFHSIPDNLKLGQSVVDLVRVTKNQSGGQYDGICW